MENGRYLSDLNINETATLSELTALGDMRRRLRDLGFVEGTRTQCVCKSPLGDPMGYLIRGAVIALRRSDAATIRIVG